MLMFKTSPVCPMTLKGIGDVFQYQIIDEFKFYLSVTHSVTQVIGTDFANEL